MPKASSAALQVYWPPALWVWMQLQKRECYLQQGWNKGWGSAWCLWFKSPHHLTWHYHGHNPDSTEKSSQLYSEKSQRSGSLSMISEWHRAGALQEQKPLLERPQRFTVSYKFKAGPKPKHRWNSAGGFLLISGKHQAIELTDLASTSQLGGKARPPQLLYMALCSSFHEDLHCPVLQNKHKGSG